MNINPITYFIPKSKNHEKFLKHKQLFSIKDTEELSLFEQLINKSEKTYLECSIKLEKNKINPVRFNIFYEYSEKYKKINTQNHIKNINYIFNFLKEVSSLHKTRFNYSLIKKVFDKDFDLKKLQRPVIGVDFREKIEKSRIKIWFIVKNYPEKIKQIISIAHIQDKMNLISNLKGILLFGFDFSFDGATKIKVYPSFKEEDIVKPEITSLLKNNFSNRVYNMMKKSKEFHIMIKKENIIHFKPKKIESFLKITKENILSRTLNKILKQALIEQGIIIALNEDEINQNNIKKANIYY